MVVIEAVPSSGSQKMENTDTYHTEEQGRTPKTDRIDSSDIWDDRDLAMLKKVWSGV